VDGWIKQLISHQSEDQPIDQLINWNSLKWPNQPKLSQGSLKLGCYRKSINKGLTNHKNFEMLVEKQQNCDYIFSAKAFQIQRLATEKAWSLTSHQKINHNVICCPVQ